MVISTTSMAPVASVLPSRASATLPPAEALAHDAGADDGRQQQAGAQRLRSKPLRPHATFGFGDVLPSVRPMSCRRCVSASRFSDAIGRLVSSEMRFLR